MNIKHIVFDFDGVIGDTFDLNLVLSQKHSITTPTLEDFLAHHDGNVYEEPKIAYDPTKVHVWYSEYAELVSYTHLENSITPIQQLAEKYTLHINSSNSEVSLIAALSKAGIYKHFEKIMGKETHRSKVEKFHMLFSEYGATPENTLFITDTLGDIKEATKVNVRTIAETFGFHNRERLALGNPYAIVDSWDEVIKEIEQLG
jgi:phosphoglycolate phosphatase